MVITKRQHGVIEYFLKGNTPTLLLLSGMHGDEAGVVDCVTDYVEKHTDTLPDFLFIPKISPSAIELKTRTNTFGHDINRNFFDPPNDPEAKDIMKIISPYQFDICLNFHEDPDRKNSTYLYDSGKLSKEELNIYQQHILATGAQLYTGIDDYIDTHLGLHVQDGYISTPAHSLPMSAGFSFVWILTHGIAKRVFDPEIPGQAAKEMKQAIVDQIFSFILNTRFS